MAPSDNLRGALFMSISMAGFTINDALAKLLADAMNMGQIMLVRGVFATAMIALLAWRSGAFRQFGNVLHPMVGLRVAGEACATILFLTALMHLPIANVSAILQALPLGVTMGAALVFGEAVGWRRWLAITVGFAGVMVIVRPGLEGFSVYSLSALGCVACCTVRDLATRRLPEGTPTLLVSSATALAVTLCGAALIVPYGGWTPMSTASIVTLLAAAVMLLFGYQFVILAMRLGDISYVAPFRYTALLWAILLGIVMFGDIPDGPMIVGATIIIGSGLYTLYRERMVGRRLPAAESTSPAMGADGL